MRQTNDATTAAKELFAERLKDKLTEYDIKQNALAEDLGVSESTVGKWILGKSMPRTMGMIEKIAARLHVGKSYFLEAEPPPSTAESEKPHKADELDLTDKETHHIKLYRALDDEGRAVVDSVTETYAERARDTETSSVSTGIGKLA